jgi:hypothetical protein
MLSNELLRNNQFLSLGTACRENEIDEFFSNTILKLGENYGIEKLISVDKPILYVVDSIDEAFNKKIEKRREIKSLFQLY